MVETTFTWPSGEYQRLTLMEPLPPLAKLFSLVLREERQRKISNQLSSLENPSSVEVNAANASLVVTESMVVLLYLIPELLLSVIKF